MAQGRFKQAGVDLLHAAYPCRLLPGTVAPLPAEQVTAQHRGEREGYQRGGKQGDDESNAQRNQHASLHARKEKQRQKTGHNNQGGVEDRDTHLL